MKRHPRARPHPPAPGLQPMAGGERRARGPRPGGPHAHGPHERRHAAAERPRARRRARARQPGTGEPITDPDAAAVVTARC